MTRGQRQAWHWALAHRGGDGALPAAKRSPVPTVGRSGGVGLSRTPARPPRSAPSTHNYRDSPLTRGETVLRPGKDNLRTNIWPIGEMWPVESLLTALRELSQGETAAAAKPAQASGGAAGQIDILLERLPVSGYWTPYGPSGAAVETGRPTPAPGITQNLDRAADAFPPMPARHLSGQLAGCGGEQPVIGGE
jgi:hypothetical protein